MPKRIHKYLFYTLIAVVYGVFFSVESFYNFEGHSEAKKLLSHASLVRLTDGNRGVSTSSARFPSSHSIRLNKRYQQENFTPCPIFRVEMPVCYVVPRTPRPYPVCPLPFITIDHSSLRGPPIAA
ncbi:MAG TPA: hypothetical protein VGQ51_02090 [Puia sp.]|jgi:hypothetical protein|nr:hypothetical protein [Puia sp.]